MAVNLLWKITKPAYQDFSGIKFNENFDILPSLGFKFMQIK